MNDKQKELDQLKKENEKLKSEVNIDSEINKLKKENNELKTKKRFWLND